MQVHFHVDIVQEFCPPFRVSIYWYAVICVHETYTRDMILRGCTVTSNFLLVAMESRNGQALCEQLRHPVSVYKTHMTLDR